MELKDLLQEVLPKNEYPNEITDVSITDDWVIITSNTGDEVLPVNQRTLCIYKLVNYCHLYARDRGYKIITELRSYGVEWVVIAREDSIFDYSDEDDKLAGHWHNNIVYAMIDATKAIINGFD